MASLFTSPKTPQKSPAEDELIAKQNVNLALQTQQLQRQEQQLAEDTAKREAAKRANAGVNAGRSVLLYDETGTLGEPDSSGLRKRLGA